MIIKYSTGKISNVYSDETEAKEKTEKEANVEEKEEAAVEKEDKEEE